MARAICRLWLLLLVFSWNDALAAAETRYIFAVIPQFAPIQAHQDWQPLLTRLEQTTGLRFQLRVYDQFPRFESELLHGLPDFAFVHPYQCIQAKQAHQYRPLVRSSEGLAGIVVVRRDSPFLTLRDLHRQTLSFPAPNALAASLYIRAILTEKERIAFTPIYAGNHQNVYRQVLRGDVQAGGGIAPTLAREPVAVREQLRILYTTPEMTSHPIVAHPRVPAAVSQRIVAALLALRKNPDDARLLAAAQLADPVEADYRRDFEPLTRLQLERYVQR